MITESDPSILYLALLLGVFSGVILTWAVLSSIPRFWKIRQRRIEEAQQKMVLARLALDQEVQRLKLAQSRLTNQDKLKEPSDLSPASEKAIENERRRIANELHDDTVQRMAAVRLRLEEFSYRLDRPELVDMVHALGEEMNQVMKSLRFLIYGLPQPEFEINSFSVLIREFLVARLNRVAAKTVEFKLENEDLEFYLPSQIKKQAYRLVQEAIQNSLKHSSGFHLNISVIWSSVLEIEIADNGQGYLGVTKEREGLGLASMEERAQSIGAKIQFMPSTYGVIVKITLLNLYSK